MLLMLQYLAVALIVAVAARHAWRSVVPRRPAPAGSRAPVGTHMHVVPSVPSSGCGGCQGCGGGACGSNR